MVNNNGTDARLVWLDYCKTIAITLVILFHSGLVTCKITVPLLAMCVPLFFVANGALVLRRERGVWYFVHKLFKILFVIVFWGALSDIITMLLNNEPLNVVDIVFAGFSFKYGYTHHLWFLGTLFVLYTIYPAIQSSMKNRGVAFFLLMASFLFSFQAFGYRLPTFEMPNILAFWHGEAFFYSILGCIVVRHVFIDTSTNPMRIGLSMMMGKRHTGDFLKVNKRFVIIILVSLFVTLWIGQLFMFVGPKFFTRHTPVDNDAAVFLLYKSPFVMLMVGVVVVLLKTLNLSRNRFVEFIGSSTLGMYVSHGVFMSLSRTFVMFCDTRVINMVTFVSGFVLSLLFTWVMSKNKFLSFFITL